MRAANWLSSCPMRDHWLGSGSGSLPIPQTLNPAQEEAFDIADRVVVFNRGRVEQEGEPAEVARSPASAFVMQFVSDVNTLPSASVVRPWMMKCCRAS